MHMCLSTLNWTNLPLRQADLRRIKQRRCCPFVRFQNGDQRTERRRCALHSGLQWSCKSWLSLHPIFSILGREDFFALSIRLYVLRIRDFPDPILFWGWDIDHQSYSRDGSGFLGFDTSDTHIFFVKRSSWTNKPPALSWRETWYILRWFTGILRIVWGNPHALSSQQVELFTAQVVVSLVVYLLFCFSILQYSLAKKHIQLDDFFSNRGSRRNTNCCKVTKSLPMWFVKMWTAPQHKKFGNQWNGIGSRFSLYHPNMMPWRKHIQFFLERELVWICFNREF